jgi:hypothetical protein
MHPIAKARAGVVTPPVHSITVQREDPRSEAATNLMRELTAEVAERYSDFRPDGSVSFNAADVLVPRSAFVIARLNSEPAGCGALRPIDAEIVEVKRMYVCAPHARRLGVGRRILTVLERLAVEFDYRVMRLETGFRQPETIALYERCGFRRIPPFGTYVGNPISVCYEKPVAKE